MYEVLPAGDAQPGPDGVAATVAVLERRLDGTGAIGRADGTARIAIDVPAGADRYVIRDLSAPVGRVEFVPLGDNSAVLPGDVLDPAEFPPLFSGEGLSAEPSDDASGGRAITLRLDDPAAIQFADYTAGSMGEYLAVTLDSEVVVAPLIETAIPDGVVQFSSGQAGGFTPDEVNRLVRLINAGALPFPLQELAR